MNLIYLKSQTFLACELHNAFMAHPGIHYRHLDLPALPTEKSAEKIFEALKPFLPAIVVSVNDAGYDGAARLDSLLVESGSYRINWYCDHPFYEYLIGQRKMPPMDNRLDFVTEEWFVEPMRQRGFQSAFLPLAVDPVYFNMDEQVDEIRDCAFVGDSSLQFMDNLMGIGGLAESIEHNAQLFNTIKQRYYKNPRTDLLEYLSANNLHWHDKISCSAELFAFGMEWMAGYMYRRDFIRSIAQRFGEQFTCFGDSGWEQFINPLQVSADACYYSNLCRYYRSTKINFNMNRIQIRTAFTQRVFDCKACGAFFLTDRRDLIPRFFSVDGPQREIVQYESLNDCLCLIDYYLKHEDERRRIALNGREKVLAYHTYKNRIDEMLMLAKKKWGI